MRELTSTEIETVSGAGIMIEGKCYVVNRSDGLAFVIGYVKEAIRQIWSSPQTPDPWR